MTTGSKRTIAAWCFYDFANSGYVTVIVTFVFAAYFSQAIAPSPELGTAWWGSAQAISSIIIALASPVFGVIADQTGPRKPWILAFSIPTVLATASLWWATPSADVAMFALAMVVIGNIGFEVAQVFYNAMLPRVAGPALLGRVSGWAWGVGYLGGLLCLVISLVVFIQADPPPFGLDAATAEPVRATALLVAAWFLIFSLPLFVWVPDERGHKLPIGVAAASGLRRLWQTFKHARQHPNVIRFLVARMFYNDGVNVIFAFGGIFAAGTFKMELAEVIQLGIALNVSAGLGAFAFGWLDDKFGSVRTVNISLVAIIVMTVAVLLSPDKTTFWITAIVLSTFFGPVQASSRTLMARIAPPDARNEMFGLFAVTGKAISFLGPITVGWATAAFASQRLGMATVIAFFLIGLYLMRGVTAQPEKSI